MAVMVTSGHAMDGGDAIRKVNETLRGPIFEILARHVPELNRLPAARAYERTLDDIGLLQRCFAAFRAHREAFRAVLMDARQQPVDDDSTLLACGRSLEQVVAMVVRTAAKRYFRRALAPDGHHAVNAARARARMPAKGFAHRMKSLFREVHQTSATHRPEPARSRADELYDAIKARLLHEWQVPLVPTYASMTPTLVRALGDKLLDIRDPALLRRIADDPAEAAHLFDAPAQAAAVTAPVRKEERARLSHILTPDGRRLRAEAFAAILLRPDVRAELGGAPQGLHLTETLRGVGAMAAKLLVAELGLRPEQLAVMLLVARHRIGPELFGRVFGVPGEVELIMRITQKARQSGLSHQSTLAECATFIRQLFANFTPGGPHFTTGGQ